MVKDRDVKQVNENAKKDANVHAAAGVYRLGYYLGKYNNIVKSGSEDNLVANVNNSDNLNWCVPL